MNNDDRHSPYKTYNIVLNRGLATSQSNPFKYIFYFNFDWSILPNQDYIVYTYLATNSYIYKTGTVQYSYVLLATNAFQGETYTNTPNIIQDKNVSALGYIYPTTVVGGGLSYSYWATHLGAYNNIPTYLTGRPTNNNFYFTYLNGDLTDTYTNQEYDLSQFVLTLKFVPAGNKRNIMNKINLARQITFENLTTKTKKYRQTYNVVLNSELSYDNTSNKTCKFYFDWSVLPDCAYEVYVTSQSGFGGGWLGASYGSFPCFTIDCFNSNNFQATKDKIDARTTTRLINLWAERNSNNVNFATTYIMNEPIYLYDRPRLNDFTILVMNSWLTNLFAFTFSRWVLNLKFVPLE
jgi:hypothetical protein